MCNCNIQRCVTCTHWLLATYMHSAMSNPIIGCSEVQSYSPRTSIRFVNSVKNWNENEDGVVDDSWGKSAALGRRMLWANRLF